jgi:hypothetical protein
MHLYQVLCLVIGVAALAHAAPPVNQTYCCGVSPGPDCGGPDWTPIVFDFGPNGKAQINITIDFTASTCTEELYKVNGSTIVFPTLANQTDCLGNVLRSTGALTGDLVVSFDSTQDTVTVEVDSEGVTAVLQSC